MDFKKIAQDYPKAFKLLDETLASYSNPRDLYDFFDQNNLNIRIIPDNTINSYKMNPRPFCWAICWIMAKENHKLPVKDFFDFAQCTDIYGQEGEYPTRLHAENPAFIKAFELLDKRLSGIDIDKLTT